MLVLAEPLASLPAHLLQQPEADVGRGELGVYGGLLEPLRVEVLGGAVAHGQPELLQVILFIQIHLVTAASAHRLLGRLPPLLALLRAQQRIKTHEFEDGASTQAAAREIERGGVVVLY